MSVGTFPDGFPLDAAQAIEFSYFLTDQEKSEWRSWLTKANEEDKQELVNTLHDIWVENQKNAVPEQFADNAPAPIPEPKLAPAQAPAPIPTPEPIKLQEAPKPAPAPQIATPQAQAKPSESKPVPKYTFNEEDKTPPKPTNNLNSNNQTNTSINNSNNNQKKDNSNNNIPPRDKNNNQKDSINENEKNNNNKSDDHKKEIKSGLKSDFFDLSKVRKISQDDVLDKIYNEFSSTSKRQEKMFQDILGANAGLEEVTKYFDLVSDRMVELNDKLGKLGRENQQLKSSIQRVTDDNSTSNDDIRAELDILKSEIEKMHREQRQMRKKTNDQLDEIQTIISNSEYDVYKIGGLVERVAVLESLSKEAKTDSHKPKHHSKSPKKDTEIQEDYL